MDGKKHILVFRFSALGDVAMTVPVVRLLLQHYSGLHLTFVSVPFVAPMFAGIDRLEFVGVDLKKDYSGLAGLSKLARRLKKIHDFSAVADLHNVLRTKVIRLFLTGMKKAVIDKGRAEKKELTRPHNKNLHPLKSGFQRYADVFAALGYPVDLDAVYVNKPIARPGLIPAGAGKKLIGIAPFARHLPKMYPLDQMQQVVNGLAAHPDVQVILFGSKAEATVLDAWEKEGVVSVAGKMGFADELNLISQLDLMVSMDSANMHLASLYSVPVVSIWGGTHPFLGFYGWRQSMDNALQSDLPCRPSSVFGNKPCPVHGEQGCMEGMTPEVVVSKILSNLTSY